MGDFNAGIGEGRQPSDGVGQCGETKTHTNGVDMLKFLEKNEIKTLHKRVQKARCAMDLTKRTEEKSFVLDHGVVEYGSSKCMRSGRRNYGPLPSMDRWPTDESYEE